MPDDSLKIGKGSALSRILALRGAAGADWLQAAIDNWLETPGQDERAGGWMHASLLDEDCDRYVGYVYAGVRFSEKIDALTWRKFRTGDKLEERVIEELDGAGLLDYSFMHKVNEHWHGNTQEIEEFRIRFTPDAVIHHPEHAEDLFVVEIKSCNNRMFHTGWRGQPGYGTKPSQIHVDRTNVYMGALGIHRAILYYECKDCHEVKTHFLNYDSELWEKRKFRANVIRKLVDAEQTPQKTIQPFGGCLKCPFYGICTDETPPLTAPKLIKGIFPR